MYGVGDDCFGSVDRRHRNAAYRGPLATALQEHPQIVGFPEL